METLSCPLWSTFQQVIPSKFYLAVRRYYMYKKLGDEINRGSQTVNSEGLLDLLHDFTCTWMFTILKDSKSQDHTRHQILIILQDVLVIHSGWNKKFVTKEVFLTNSGLSQEYFENVPMPGNKVFSHSWLFTNSQTCKDPAKGWMPFTSKTKTTPIRNELPNTVPQQPQPLCLVYLCYARHIRQMHDVLGVTTYRQFCKHQTFTTVLSQNLITQLS